MKKHEQPTHRLEKMSNFFGGSNFSKLNLYYGKAGAALPERYGSPGIAPVLWSP